MYINTVLQNAPARELIPNPYCRVIYASQLLTEEKVVFVDEDMDVLPAAMRVKATTLYPLKSLELVSFALVPAV